ncbi:MAG: N-acetyl-gamma-glutamyl-phosphate reductase [Bacteroidetes bacterium]|uniref:N-acetyl-gamma-glutamyl-phosphate reductase n=1 Tax=Candidatus Cryptobacteroides intestinavium TaxID=2840766 RepID=A0A9D9ES54_9BACT|nr:N-acetyl-gamma-glutamyl-phosphate reductase [Candidatus Cryptobacteroides intestinavium]
MIRAAIAGGTGYTGGELFRILLGHPEVQIVAATTTSSDGVPVTSVHRDLVGETDLCFGTELNNPDVIFLCLGHGISRQFIDTHDISRDCRIIDLGNDFRLDGDYAGRHFVYGLCESARDEIVKAHDIANPGCFATAIQLALLPLASGGLINDEVHVSAITGSTGAGKKPGETTHFSYRDNNISIYKLFTHQHLGEIRMNLGSIAGKEPVVNFVPFRGDFTRGIFASVYTRAAEGISETDYRQLFEEYYAASPFVFHSDEGISLKEVVNTNKALLHLELHNGYVHISSAIDNLVKGAAGQAVQNMNIMFGLPETTGLRLKPSAF